MFCKPAPVRKIYVVKINSRYMNATYTKEKAS